MLFSIVTHQKQFITALYTRKKTANCEIVKKKNNIQCILMFQIAMSYDITMVFRSFIVRLLTHEFIYTCTFLSIEIWIDRAMRF